MSNKDLDEMLFLFKVQTTGGTDAIDDRLREYAKAKLEARLRERAKREQLQELLKVAGITQADIADRAKSSQGQVGKCLRGEDGVALETRRAIIAAMERMLEEKGFYWHDASVI